MRRIFLLLSFATLWACNNNSQFIEPINDMLSNWDQSQVKLTNFTNLIARQQERWAGKQANLNLSENILAKLSASQKVSIDSLSQVFNSYGDQFSSMSEQVLAFSNTWQEKHAEVKELKNILDGGKGPSNIQEQLDELNQSIETANKNIANWGRELNKANVGVEQTYNQYAAIIESLD